MTAAREWILKIISGPHQGAEEVLRPGRTVVGTDPECDIVLHDMLLAPRHLAFHFANDAVTVEPLEGRVHYQGRRVLGPLPVSKFTFVTAGTTHFVLGPSSERWPL